MNNSVVFLILGFIIGYFIIMTLTNRIHYHGLNSKKVRNSIFVYGNKKVQFVPKIKQ